MTRGLPLASESLNVLLPVEGSSKSGTVWSSMEELMVVGRAPLLLKTCAKASAGSGGLRRGGGGLPAGGLARQGEEFLGGPGLRPQHQPRFVAGVVAAGGLEVGGVVVLFQQLRHQLAPAPALGQGFPAADHRVPIEPA